MRNACNRCLKGLQWDDDNFWLNSGFCSKECYFEIYPTMQAGQNGIFIAAFERPECYETIIRIETVKPELIKSAMLLLCAIEDIEIQEWAIPFDKVYRVICPLYDDYKVVSTQALTKFDHTQFNNWCLAKKLLPTTP